MLDASQPCMTRAGALLNPTPNHADPASMILLPLSTGNSVEKTNVVPDVVPRVPQLWPDISIDMQTGSPQIRTFPPVDIISQSPSSDILPGGVGPR